jgi:hypothetical protein
VCEHRFLDDPAGLLCTRQDVHQSGHTYESTSSTDDKHDEGGHG